MRRLPVVIGLFCISWAAFAQQPTGTGGPVTTTIQTPPTGPQPAAASAGQTGTFWVPEPDERWWFPKGNWIYGYAEFDLAPPHNEPDPNFCAANAGHYGGANSQCNLFARYLLGGEVSVRPFGKTALRRIKIFWNPTFVFGKNVPPSCGLPCVPLIENTPLLCGASIEPNLTIVPGSTGLPWRSVPIADTVRL